MSAWGMAKTLPYAAITSFAVVVVTWVLSGLNVIADDSQPNFGEAVTVPSFPSSIVDAVGFLTGLVRIPFDAALLIVDVMSMWLELSTMFGFIGVVFLLPVAVIAITIAIWMVTMANIIKDLIPFT